MPYGVFTLVCPELCPLPLGLAVTIFTDTSLVLFVVRRGFGATCMDMGVLLVARSPEVHVHGLFEVMAMAAPPCCACPFVPCRTSDTVPLCPCAGLYSRRSSRPQPMGSGGDATPCKVTRDDRRLHFLMCRVSFKAHSHTALKDVLPSTQDPRAALGGHATTHLGTVPMNGRADPRTAFPQVSLAALLFQTRPRR